LFIYIYLYINKQYNKTELRKALLVEAEKKTIKRIWLSNDILDVNKKSWKELQDMIDDDDLYNEEAGDSYGRK
jgi:hypothetical protein